MKASTPFFATLALAHAVALGAPAHAAPPATTTYSWINLEHRGGELTRSVDARGRIRVNYAYLDNGRGPKLVEEIATDDAGIPVEYSVAGTTTFGSKVKERFRQRAGRAEWTTTADSGTARPASPGLYVPISGTPESNAVLARALLARPDGKLSALPGGELSISKVRSETLRSEAGTRTVSLYAIAGADLSPHYVWLDDADRQLFAELYPGVVGTILAGWERSAAQLVEHQKQAENALLERLPAVAHRSLGDSYAIRDVHVLDARSGRLGERSTVYVWRGRIAATFPAGTKVPADVPVVEGRGRTLMPALIDMHGHESRWNAALQIAGGVTTVRDMGIDRVEMSEMTAAFDAGRWLGPRLWKACFIDGKSPFSSQGDGVAASLDEALGIVDECARKGYGQVKLYSSFQKDWIAPVVRHAHSLGMRVSGHIPAFVTATEAVQLGYDEIQHINQVMLNFVAGPKDDTRTLARFYLVGERVADLDLDGAQVREFLQLLKSEDVAIDPTLATFEDMFVQGPGEPSTAYAAVVEHLPVSHQRARRQNQMAVTPATLAKFRASWRKMLDMVRRLDAAGVTIVPGTDEIAGFTQHRELELWVQAGIPAPRVLQLATLGSARLMKLDHEIGAIEPGYSADMILVDGDPTQDISALRKIALVFQRGVAYSPAAIYESLGIKPFTADPQITRPAAQTASR